MSLRECTYCWDECGRTCDGFIQNHWSKEKILKEIERLKKHLAEKLEKESGK